MLFKFIFRRKEVVLLSVVVYICFEVDIRVSIVLNECVYFNVLYVINDKFIGIYVVEKVLKIIFKFCKMFFLK